MLAIKLQFDGSLHPWKAYINTPLLSGSWNIKYDELKYVCHLINIYLFLSCNNCNYSSTHVQHSRQIELVPNATAPQNQTPSNQLIDTSLSFINILLVHHNPNIFTLSIAKAGEAATM